MIHFLTKNSCFWPKKPFFLGTFENAPFQSHGTSVVRFPMKFYPSKTPQQVAAANFLTKNSCFWPKKTVFLGTFENAPFQGHETSIVEFPMKFYPFQTPQQVAASRISIFEVKKCPQLLLCKWRSGCVSVLVLCVSAFVSLVFCFFGLFVCLFCQSHTDTHVRTHARMHKIACQLS